MAKYGFSTTIPYGSDLFEVTGVEFCEWEDALEKCPEGDTNAMAWATYDVLMNNGYLVSQPTGERPITEPEEKAKPKGRAAGSKRKVKAAAAATTRNPGLLPANDGFDAVLNYVAGETREPIWTQSRILTERDRLLREREKIAAIKEKALNQKILEQQILERAKQTEAHSSADMGYILGGIVIVAFVIVLGALIYSS